MLRVEAELFGGFSLSYTSGGMTSRAFHVLNPLAEAADLLAYHREQINQLPPFLLPGEGGVYADKYNTRWDEQGIEIEQPGPRTDLDAQLSLYTAGAPADTLRASGSEKRGGGRPPVSNTGGKVAW